MRPSPPITTSTSFSSFSPTIDRNSPALSSSTSPATGRGHLDLVQGWDDGQVAAWLTEVGAGQHAELFAKNDIRGGVLLDVDQSALKEMGMRSVGDRVRIAVAIKQLRHKCQQSRAALDRASPTRSTFNSHSGADLGRSNGLSRGSGRVPPPLHLTQSNTDLPQAYQPQSSARPGPTSARSIPPLLPPPRSQPPPPPNGRSPPTQNQALPRTGGGPPSISTTAASPTQAIGNSSGYPDYGLTRVGSASSLSGYRTTSTSPSSTDRARPPTGVVPSRPSTSAQASSYQHRKPGSNVSALGQQRPSTTSSTPSYAHNQPLSSHPYATSGSPTQEGFNVPSYGRAPAGGQATAGPSNLKLSLLPSPAIAPGAALSPVSEGYSTRTGLSRPTTPGGLVTPSGPQQSSSLDAVLRKAVKFVADDGGSKMIAVTDCQSGREVLGRVLRKFGKIGPNEGDDQNDVEGWGAYTAASDGGLRLLSEGELFGICQNVNAPERVRGLAIQRIHLAKQNRKLQWMLGENMPAISNRPGGVAGTSPTSPNYLGAQVPYTNVEPASPSGSSSGGSDRRLSAEPSPMTQQERGKMNRASTISVMSGLGAGEYLDVAQPASRSPSSGTGQSSRKLRNFFGQRPPSELIATHLTEFFPKAEKNKLLSKQVRQSMRRSMVRRDSRSSSMTAPMPSGTSWENAPDRYSLSPSAESRFSGSSGGSSGLILPTTSTTPDDGSATSAGLPPRAGRLSSGSGRAPTLAPPDEEGEEEDELGDARSVTSSLLAKAGRRTSRASYSSRLSVNRKDSDTASVITVDDVTAELEHRRASMASFVESDDEAEPVYIPGLAHHLRPPSIALSRDDDFDEEEEDEEEESTEEESEEEEAEAVASKPAKSGLKWIKGALIGVGAFGSVFLGMNPLSGSLMAVKQVELPTGNSHNEERKKSMLDALEREIELLKVLRHENIVQYLDSSSDDTHLNIFLEYVPGGSVAALLSNYGAFEEALVSKFVRQILTGLDYLHEREIIHRDIKGANILVDNKGGIKISDFGISKKVEDNLLTGAKVHRPSLQGSVYWMAPEVVKQTAYTSKADIWSLGCLVVEMLTGAHPWANLTQMQAIFRIGSSVRPTVPEDISTEADDFLEQTFEIDHTERPSARDLLEHGFIKEEGASKVGGGGAGAGGKEQQTPTRATFSQAGAA